MEIFLCSPRPGCETSWQSSASLIIIPDMTPRGPAPGPSGGGWDCALRQGPSPPLVPCQQTNGWTHTKRSLLLGRMSASSLLDTRSQRQTSGKQTQAHATVSNKSCSNLLLLIPNVPLSSHLMLSSNGAFINSEKGSGKHHPGLSNNKVHEGQKRLCF